MDKSLTALNEAELLSKAPALLDLKTLHKGFSIKDWETKNIHLHQPPKEVYTKSIDLSYTPPLRGGGGLYFLSPKGQANGRGC